MKKIIAAILCMLLVAGMIPVSLMLATAEATSNRVVDASTMDEWKNYFGEDVKSTANAGGVWTDKSVFSDTDEFPDSVKMTDENNNLLVALSAIASKKSINGISHSPTDTMIVVDLSGSMYNKSEGHDDVTPMVSALNTAIKKIEFHQRA